MSEPAAPPPEPKPLPERIMSVDALRGFDMFWITGGKDMVVALLALFLGTLPPWLEFQLEHVPWEGFVAWDMIMPLFLFIVGTSIPFAFRQRMLSGKGGPKIYLKIIRRVLILWVLGMIAQGHLLGSIKALDPSMLHFYSNTLQSIAAGYLVASLVVLNLPRWGQIVTTIVLLASYWLLLVLVPFPGHAAGVLEPHANIAMWVDETILGRFRDGTPYTWILSSLGFAATVMLGVHSGQILQMERPQKTRLLWLMGMALGCLAVGWLWSYSLPFIKHIWTSSMVLWAAGWSFLLLAFFYYVIDMKGFKKWAFPFMVVGMNAIAAYMGAPVILRLLESGLGLLCGGDLKGIGHILEAIFATLSYAVVWAGLYLMYRKRWFVKI
ncbi:MAG TPA: DUF5009 domain-containing protein [Candidatus Hydrogenedentes bacterium]|nr:DUF5009 domain-containing protein [Candidatus Hydrogenedentota bacterium]